MSSTHTTDIAPVLALRPTGSHPVEVVRSELCKFRSVRSTWWTLVSAVTANLAIAAVVAVFVPSHLSVRDKTKTDAVRLSLAGIHLSQIALGVLGVLVISSEYGTGAIRTTFATVPQRRLVLAAKAIVLAGAVLVAGIASCVAAYGLYDVVLPSGASPRAGFADPGVLRAAVGGGLYLTVLALLGFGLGALLRSSAGAIATLFAVLFVPVILVSVLPSSWQNRIGPYLPMDAGEQIFIASHHDPGSLSPWTGFAVFSLYAIAALIAGFLTTTHRDA